MHRITVCSFAPGSLAVEVISPSGNILRSRASVRTIRSLLGTHGYSISADDLAAVAFCGQKRIYPAETETRQWESPGRFNRPGS